jgi:hypothetical protein
MYKCNNFLLYIILSYIFLIYKVWYRSCILFGRYQDEGEQRITGMNDRYEVQEKRGLQRFDLRLYTVLEELENRANQLELYTRDISSDGAYICTEEPLPLETPVELTFFLPVKQKIRSKIQTNGKVVRSEKDGIAVRFHSKYQILSV